MKHNYSNNCFIKQNVNGSPETGSIGSLNFIEKICAIDDLCLNDSSFQDPGNHVIIETEEVASSGASDHTTVNTKSTAPVFHSDHLATKFRNQVTKSPNNITPIEELQNASNNDDVDDTASEISEIPTDDEKDKNDEYSGDTEYSACDNKIKSVPTDTHEEQKSAEDEEDSKNDYSSSFSDSSQSSLSSQSNNASSYTSQNSYNSPLSSNSVQNTCDSSENQVNFVDRFKKQESPDNSLHELRTNEETKTTCESRKEVKPDKRDIREEIKVEFERQHKYIRSKDFIKKSPEDSGFESFQQSSVEQNSNQDSDEEDVVATFSTVMEVENECSTVQDDHCNKLVDNNTSYVTYNLFTEAEEARTRSRRLREESFKQLGPHLSNMNSSIKTLASVTTSVPSKVCHIPITSELTESSSGSGGSDTMCHNDKTITLLKQVTLQNTI